MAMIDSKSCICVNSELDLFSVPPTQTSVDRFYSHRIQRAGVGRRLHGLCKQFSTRHRKNNEQGRNGFGPRHGSRTGKFVPAQPFLANRHVFERQIDHFVRQHLRLQSLLWDAPQLRKSRQRHAVDRISLVQGHGGTHGRCRRGRRWSKHGIQNSRSNIERKQLGRHTGKNSRRSFLSRKLLLNGIGMRIRLVRSKDEFVLATGERRQIQSKNCGGRVARSQGSHSSRSSTRTRQSSGDNQRYVYYQTRRLQDFLHFERKSGRLARKRVSRQSSFMPGFENSR